MDQDIDHIGLGIEVILVNVLEDRGLCHDPPAVPGQVFQETELLRLERNRLSSSPGFVLPRDFYVDPVTYAAPVEAYKQYIVDIARVMTREIGQNVDDAVLRQKAEDIFTLESTFAEVILDFGLGGR